MVLVADSGAVVTLGEGFTHLTAGDITLVSPANGQEGTTVTINGTNLLGGGDSIVSVTLVDVAVNSITSSSNDVVVVEAGAAGSKGAAPAGSKGGAPQGGARRRWSWWGSLLLWCM